MIFVEKIVNCNFSNLFSANHDGLSLSFPLKHDKRLENANNCIYSFT